MYFLHSASALPRSSGERDHQTSFAFLGLCYTSRQVFAG